MSSEPYPVGKKVYATYLNADHKSWTQDEPGIVTSVAGPTSNYNFAIYTITFMDGVRLALSSRGVSDKKNASEYSRNINAQRRNGNEWTDKAERRSGGEPV